MSTVPHGEAPAHPSAGACLLLSSHRLAMLRKYMTRHAVLVISPRSCAPCLLGAEQPSPCRRRSRAAFWSRCTTVCRGFLVHAPLVPAPRTTFSSTPFIMPIGWGMPFHRTLFGLRTMTPTAPGLEAHHAQKQQPSYPASFHSPTSAGGCCPPAHTMIPLPAMRQRGRRLAARVQQAERLRHSSGLPPDLVCTPCRGSGVSSSSGPCPSKNYGFACLCSYCILPFVSIANGKHTCGMFTISVP